MKYKFWVFFCYSIKRYWLLLLMIVFPIFLNLLFCLQMVVNTLSLGVAASAFTIFIFELSKDWKIFKVIAMLLGNYEERDPNDLMASPTASSKLFYKGGNCLKIETTHFDSEGKKVWIGLILLNWDNPTVGDLTYSYVNRVKEVFGTKKFIFPQIYNKSEIKFFLVPIENKLIQLGKVGKKEPTYEYANKVFIKV